MHYNVGLMFPSFSPRYIQGVFNRQFSAFSHLRSGLDYNRRTWVSHPMLALILWAVPMATGLAYVSDGTTSIPPTNRELGSGTLQRQILVNSTVARPATTKAVGMALS